MADQDRVFAKCAWRLIPFMGLLYLLNFLDRLNVGFAALTMNKDLGFSFRVFGFGAGALYAGYLLFQIPGGAMIERVGVRRAMFGIIAAWGLLSAGCAFVQGPLSFYLLRFLLGAAEAGFFPGVMFYLTLWFPKEYRARYAAGFVSAAAYAGIVGGPLSGLILARLDGFAGLHGWQWLFLLEGLPAFFLAVAVWKLLPDAPAHAPWLSAAEKAVIASRLPTSPGTPKQHLFGGLRDARIIALAVAGFPHGLALYGPTIWLPLIVQGMGFSNLATGFVVAVPYLISAVVMIAWGRSSDQRGERVWHLVLAWLLSASGLGLAAATQITVLELLGLTLAVVGILTAITQLMTLPGLIMGGPGSAGAVGLINMVVALGGVVGPAVIGVIREQTGSYSLAMAMIAFGLVLSSALVLAIRRSLVPTADLAGARVTSTEVLSEAG